MDNKDKILDATDLLFADRGYNLSMSDIAKEVGIKVPSIYSHYSGKDEIILLVVEREINHFYSFLLDEINEMDELPCEEKLKKIYYLILNYYKKENRLRFWKSISLIQNLDLKMQCGDLVREKEKLVRDVLHQIFEKGTKKSKENGVDIEGMVSFYFVLIKGVMDMMLVYQSKVNDLDLFYDTIWNEYWISIKNRCAV
ncbi:MAG: TetR/AcrR family transcriptional regulator [Butyrivibrio sp.]|nr:TetR/AcrR family transcriptional regulator [Butyrivibrio sp.]